MLKIAVYEKGGIGKPTISSNLSVTLSERGYRVMQIGCDPEADSIIQFHQGHIVTSILDIVRAGGDKTELDELVIEGSGGVLYTEMGSPTPSMGCVGCRTTTAFEVLGERNAFEIYRPDVAIYDVLGDVVHGGFAMPIWEGYVDKVFIVMSGENTAIYAAADITAAVKSSETRGYASLEGILPNRRDVKREQEKVEELAEDVEMEIIGSPDYSPPAGEAEEFGKTVIEACPDSDTAGQYRKMTDAVLAACGEEEVKKAYT